MTAPLASDAAIPLGPYRVEMTFDIAGKRHTPPYIIVAENDQVIAGHIDNLAAAKLIAERLNGAA